MVHGRWFETITHHPSPINQPGGFMDNHIRILAVLFYVLGIIGILASIAFFVLGAGTVATILSQNDSNEARVGAAWAGGCITAIGALIGILAIPSIIAGYGLTKRRRWAWMLTVILAVLSLPEIPIGTVIGVYALVILFKDETKQLLNT
jgi:hypothetical protein